MSTQTITFNVSDMHCESCPKLISLGLQDLDGVISVNASLQNHTFTVEFDPSLVTPETLSNTIKNSGYTPSLQ